MPWRAVVVTAAWVACAGSGASQVLTAYSSEAGFLAATSGTPRVVEGFEGVGPWDPARTVSPSEVNAVPAVTDLGITWTSNHPGNLITTSSGAARSGAWGLYSVPHGDPSAGANDPILDGVAGASNTPLTAVGGWFKGSSGGHLAVVLDGGAEISLGALGPSFRFYGVVFTGGSFTGFEFRETEGTMEDQKLVFADDFILAGDLSASVPAIAGAVAGVANTAGLQGSDWHSDLYLHNASTHPLVLELLLSSAPGGVGEPVMLTIEPESTERLADVMATLFGSQGSGAVLWRVVAGDGTRLVVNGATFNRVDAARRYGQQLQGVAASEAIPAGGEGRVVGVSSDERTRSNLLLQNLCAEGSGELVPATAVVTVVDGAGSVVAARSYPLTAGEYRQHNRFLTEIGAAGIVGASVVVTVDEAGGACPNGGVVAMVSEVNGAALPGTNDGRLIQAVVLPVPR